MNQKDYLPQEKTSNEPKRYYWLKLRKDFFKSHKIRILENMPNGIYYLVFYLKLLAESISHSGNLRFSEELAYSDEMLAAITNINVDMVRVGLKVLQDLELLEYHEDGTIFLPESIEMIGSETDSAERVRKHRDSQRKALHCNTEVTKCNRVVTDVFSPPTTPSRDTRVYITDNKELNGSTLIDRDKPTSNRSGNNLIDGLVARLYKRKYLQHPEDDPSEYRYKNLFFTLLQRYDISNLNQSLNYVLTYAHPEEIDDKYNWLYTSLVANCEKYKDGIQEFNQLDDEALINLARSEGYAI